MKTLKATTRRVISLAAAGLAVLLATLPGVAQARMQFTELRGVPEHLGAHNLALDLDWFWATLLLLAVVVTLWLFHRRDRSK